MTARIVDVIFCAVAALALQTVIVVGLMRLSGMLGYQSPVGSTVGQIAVLFHPMGGGVVVFLLLWAALFALLRRFRRRAKAQERVWPPAA